MTFGSEMLDKLPEIEQYGQCGGEAVSRLAEYLRKCATLSEEYARGLLKLHRAFSPAQPFDLGIEELLNRASNVANAHMLLAEQVQGPLIEGVRQTIREHDRQRKETLEEIRNLKAGWKKNLAAFEKIKKSRDAAVKAAEEARGLFEKANLDKNVTKAYVEKLREDYALKARKTLVCKEEYLQAARSIRLEQEKFYNETLSAAFNKLQVIEEGRVSRSKLHLLEFLNLAIFAINEDVTHLKSITAKMEKVVPAAIVQHFIDCAKSEDPFEYPEEISIEDQLSSGAGVSPSAQASLQRSETKLSTRSSKSTTALLLADDPESISMRLTDLEKELALLEKQYEGASVLGNLYRSQPELADEKIQNEAFKQAAYLAEKVEALKEEREQLCTKFASLQRTERTEKTSTGNLKVNSQPSSQADPQKCQILPPAPPKSKSGRPHSASPKSPASISPQTDNSSVVWNNSAIEGPPADDQSVMRSPLPGAPDSCLSAIEPSVDEGECCGKEVALCEAKVLFDFDARDPEEELSVKAGETISIYNNDGEWWQARNGKGRRGYVPYNYVSAMPVQPLEEAKQ